MASDVAEVTTHLGNFMVGSGIAFIITGSVIFYIGQNWTASQNKEEVQETTGEDPTQGKYCLSCGTELPSEAEFCFSCGKDITSIESSKQ